MYLETLARRTKATLQLQTAWWRVAKTSAEVRLTFGRLRLLRYQSKTTQGTPLLIVPSLIGRYYLFDLLPQRSLVRFLSERGFDVWLIDWRAPRPEDNVFGLGDQVSRYLARCVREVQRATQSEQVSLLGYSLGGVMSAAYTALSPEHVRSLTLLSTPIDFHKENLIGEALRSPFSPVESIVKMFGEAPAWLIQSGFLGLKPELFWKDVFSLWASVDGEPREEIVALHRWLQDGVAIPAKTFQEIVRELYQKNRLIEGGLTIEDQKISLSNISCPLLTVVAAEDHICPPAASLAIVERVKSKEIETIKIPGAHTAAAISADILWPRLSAWLRKSS